MNSFYSVQFVPDQFVNRITETYFYCAAYTVSDQRRITHGLVLFGYLFRFKEDIFKAGQIGGRCRLFVDKLKAESEHRSPLQSW
jgi:hypothetical protein